MRHRAVNKSPGKDNKGKKEESGSEETKPNLIFRRWTFFPPIQIYESPSIVYNLPVIQCHNVFLPKM